MSRPTAYIPGTDPEKDAWIANFYNENHLSYEVFPREVASPEQLRFIVHMDDEPYYYPCTDKVFEAIIEKKGEEFLPLAYMKVWERLEKLVRSVVEDEYKKKFLLSLLRIKFRHETASLVILPTRLEKRLLQIFTQISEIDRPLGQIKEAQNRRLHERLNSKDFKDAFNDPEGIELPPKAPLDEVDLSIRLLQLRRLVALSGYPELWTGAGRLDRERFSSLMATPLHGTGWDKFEATLRRWARSMLRRYILWMGASAGEILLDLAMIRILINMGIKVIISVKKAFYYDSITLNDVMEDPYLQEALSDAKTITNPHVSKKELLNYLKSDRTLFVVSDGTQEEFNPLLTSITFARAFKEADAVVSRGAHETPCLLQSHFQFTRDIFTIFREKKGRLVLTEKPRHPGAIRFSETDLRTKAEALIYHLRMQKRRGKTIMFYSAIVGSIPHQMETAKKILKIFVEYLRKKQTGILVINPAEHFEPGMDADDIMYMWEFVQRSGLIDIWRFQSVDDIEKAFELMGEKVPPEWIGKDATYSTGCTKEMQIALAVQKKNPEMQIIGPSWEKFLRRKEYGVGKLYDRVLGDV